MSKTPKTYTILYVDDELENLTGFKFLFRRYYHILLANSGEEAMEILAQQPVHLVLADQRMPKMTGSMLLGRIATQYPDVSRIIVTGYSDIEGIIEAVNKGGIYYYVTKPWNADELRVIIDRSLEAYQLRYDKKKLIDDLKASNSELDTFLYRSSHDLRRPITTMMGLAQVAQISLRDPAALELFEKVADTAKAMNAMLRKLYMVNDIEYEEEPWGLVEVRELAQEVLDELRPLAVAKGARVRLEVPADAPRLFINRQLLRNILFNLFENALVFSRPNDPWVLVQAIPEAESWRILVSDNGQGIAPALLPQVFDMYFVGNEQSPGNGLGLYVVKRSVAKLQGDVRITSELYEGTQVWLELPIVPAAP